MKVNVSITKFGNASYLHTHMKHPNKRTYYCLIKCFQELKKKRILVTWKGLNVNRYENTHFFLSKPEYNLASGLVH